MDYYTEKEKTDCRRAAEFNIESIKNGVNSLRSTEFGRMQRRYLEALPEKKISDDAKNRLRVWRGKFGPIDNRSFEVVDGCGGSPIPRERLHLVSDSVWRTIISSSWDRRDRRVRQSGENVIESDHATFSSDFRLAAHMMPRRFSKLMVEMAKNPVPALPRYYDALLLALAETKEPKELPDELRPWRPASVEEIEEVFGCFPRHEEAIEARNFCRLVGNRAEEEWSPEVLCRVAELAEHPDPDDSYKFAPLEEDQVESVMYSGGPSDTVRGAAAEAVSALLFKHEDLLSGFRPTIRRLVEDSHVVVRVAARGICLPILKIEPNLAVELYLQACNHADDQALIPDSFLRYAWRTHSRKVEPLVRRMLASRFPILVRHAASLAVAAWTSEGFFPDLAEKCLRGEKARRVGSMRALSEIFRRRPDKRERCWEIITAYGLRDEGAERSWLAKLLREQEVVGSEWGPRIALHIMDGSSFERSSFWLVKSLKDFEGPLAPYADALMRLLQLLAGCEAKEIQDLRWRVDDLPALLLRLYDEADSTKDRELRDLCLSAWDRLLESGVGSALRQVEIIDSPS